MIALFLIIIDGLFFFISLQLESPDDKSLASSVVRLPGIREDGTPTTPSSTTTTIEAKSPAYPIGISLIGAPLLSTTTMSSLSAPKKQTPRIDISRASSSSHHDSRDSTPDRELFDSHDPNSAKLGLGFREDGTLDLRSSTEELDFHDPSASITTTGGGQPNENKRKGKTATTSSTTTTAPRPQSPSILMHDDTSYHNNHQRKDSQCSDIVLLSISGRTSRLSSIGSQGSAQSRLSNASHLSVMSGQSGISRSSSPHKMVLETSFCGPKPPIETTTMIEQQTNDDNVNNMSSSIGTNKETTEIMEKVLLARKHDPTEAILAEGISVQKQQQQQPPEKPARTIKSDKQCSSVVKSDITIKIDKPSSDSSNNTPKLPKKFVSKSGVEYIYIPLKGPLPVDSTDIVQQTKPSTSQQPTKPKLREVKSASTYQSKKIQDPTYKSKSATPSPVIRKKEEQPKYIRIRLKPDYMYSDEGKDPQQEQQQQEDFQKPETLDIQKVTEPPPPPPSKSIEPSTIVRSEQGKSLSSTPSASPKLSRHTYDYTTTTTTTDSVTPSPSVSRKSSFASLFKSKEAIMSPESPSSTSNTSSCKRKTTLSGILREASDGIRERSRSRSKSREREKTTTTTIISTAPSSTESIDSKTKNKSVLSIFKTNSGKKSERKIEHDTSSSETLPSIDGIGKVEFKFNEEKKSRKHELPLDGDSIRIPLHSPTYYEERNVLQDWKTSSQDSQETVIDASSRNVIVDVEPPQKLETSNIDEKQQVCISKQQTRQSSTSSDNVVFTTKLGSNNEIFTTKLPKQKQSIDDETTIVDATKIQINGHESDTKEEKKTIPKTISVTNIQDLPITIPTTVETTTPKLILKETHITTVDSTIPQQEQQKEKHVRQICEIGSNRSSILADEERNSSESERDSEMDFPSLLRGNNRRDLDLKLDLEINEPERKGLVLQQDSFDDELPYIPTTLPLERSAAVPIVPIKQRTTFEMKTKPIERPRSTTPINPSCLEEYCEEVMGTFNVESVTKTIEKLKISLPRNESQEKQTKVKSPRKTSNTTNWFEFAEKTTASRSSGADTATTTPPPPLPPKGIQKNWINFEEIPEKRKAPKRIQTIPSRGHIDVPDSVLHDNVVYNYVNPEECKCECHEINAKNRSGANLEKNVTVQEDELPLLEDDVPEDDKNGNEITDRCRSLIR